MAIFLEESFPEASFGLPRGSSKAPNRLPMSLISKENLVTVVLNMDICATTDGEQVARLT